MTFRPCGRKAKFASKGYYAKQRNRRGRQEGYVIGTWYEEIVVERLFDGKTQLYAALPGSIEAAETALELDEKKRKRTILSIDLGGGSVDDLNWVLGRGYQVHAKDYSGVCANAPTKTVTQWVTDPADSSREIGWVTSEDTPYCRPVKRITVRCRKKNSQWAVGVIISTLSSQTVLHLVGSQNYEADDPKAVLLAYVNFYDQLGGEVEIDIKEDKQSLATTKRNKKRFEAQQVLLQLKALAYNVAVWARDWLTPRCPIVARFGLKRLVRDAFQINSLLIFDQSINFLHIILN
jgi:hypothetical protein